MNKLKPFSLDDLSLQVRDRGYFQSQLAEIHNQMRVCQQKMESLLKDEARLTEKIDFLDKKILEIATEIKDA